MSKRMPSPDYIVDIEGVKAPAPASGASLVGRPWIAVEWACCAAYSRVYRNRSETAYEGRCPRCRRHVCVKIGSGGTRARFFRAE